MRSTIGKKIKSKVSNSKIYKISYVQFLAQLYNAKEIFQWWSG